MHRKLFSKARKAASLLTLALMLSTNVLSVFALFSSAAAAAENQKVCVPGSGPVAMLISSGQGDRKDGADVEAVRSTPANGMAVGGQFFSLGFGGTVTYKFDRILVDNAGSDDLKVYEVTNGSYPAEKALVEVSLDGASWTTLGEATVDNGFTAFDLPDAAPRIQYVRITDTTDASIHAADADGYDLDGVVGDNLVCPTVDLSLMPNAQAETACGIGQAVANDGLRIVVNNWVEGYRIHGRWAVGGGSLGGWNDITSWGTLTLSNGGATATLELMNTGDSPAGVANWEVMVVDAGGNSLGASDSVMYTIINDMNDPACGGPVEEPEPEPDMGTVEILKVVCEDVEQGRARLQINGEGYTKAELREILGAGTWKDEEALPEGCRLAEEGEFTFAVSHQPQGDSDGEDDGGSWNEPEYVDTDENGMAIFTGEDAGRYKVEEMEADNLMMLACLRNNNGLGQIYDNKEFVKMLGEQRLGECLAINKAVVEEEPEVGTIDILKVVCDEDDQQELMLRGSNIALNSLNESASLQALSIEDLLPEGCRLAEEGEFSFSVAQRIQEENAPLVENFSGSWGEPVVVETDENGVATFEGDADGLFRVSENEADNLILLACLSGQGIHNIFDNRELARMFGEDNVGKCLAINLEGDVLGTPTITIDAPAEEVDTCGIGEALPEDGLALSMTGWEEGDYQVWGRYYTAGGEFGAWFNLAETPGWSDNGIVIDESNSTLATLFLENDGNSPAGAAGWEVGVWETGTMPPTPSVSEIARVDYMIITDEADPVCGGEGEEVPMPEVKATVVGLVDGVACGLGEEVEDDGITVEVTNWDMDYVLQGRSHHSAPPILWTSWQDILVEVSEEGVATVFLDNPGFTPEGGAGWEFQVVDGDMVLDTVAVSYDVTNDADSEACGGTGEEIPAPIIISEYTDNGYEGGVACGIGDAYVDDGIDVEVTNWREGYVLEGRFYTGGLPELDGLRAQSLGEFDVSLAGEWTPWEILSERIGFTVDAEGRAHIFLDNTGDSDPGFAGWEFRVTGIDSEVLDVDAMEYVITVDPESEACGGDILGEEQPEEEDNGTVLGETTVLAETGMNAIYAVVAAVVLAVIGFFGYREYKKRNAA